MPTPPPCPTCHTTEHVQCAEVSYDAVPSDYHWYCTNHDQPLDFDDDGNPLAAKPELPTEK